MALTCQQKTMTLTNWIKQACHRYFVAQTFMTRLPSPVKLQWSEAELASSTPWFVAVGTVVGIIAAIAWQIGFYIWSQEIAALFAITASILATGAFHEDGLADSADGIGGAFEIEKNSRSCVTAALAPMAVLHSY